jgi:acylglycerol lipase
VTPVHDTRVAPDATKLATRRWAVADPRAAIVLVHGLAEHAGRYDHVAAAFNTRGFDVRATDLRGFGASGGRRAFVDDFSTYVDDLAPDIAAASELGVPVVLLGHSMGGLIASLYAATEHPQPDLMVLSAPAIDAKVPAIKALLAKLLVRVAPKLAISNGLKGDQLSHDPEVGERYFADPLMVHKSTVRLGFELMEAMDRAQTTVPTISQPMLIIHGGEDSIVDPGSTEAVGSLPNAQRIVLEGLRHETFNEDNGAAAVSTVSDWIDDAIPQG